MASESHSRDREQDLAKGPRPPLWAALHGAYPKCPVTDAPARPHARCQGGLCELGSCACFAFRQWSASRHAGRSRNPATPTARPARPHVWTGLLLSSPVKRKPASSREHPRRARIQEIGTSATPTHSAGAPHLSFVRRRQRLAGPAIAKRVAHGPLAPSAHARVSATVTSSPRPDTRPAP
jgi:hypothetical protein